MEEERLKFGNKERDGAQRECCYEHPSVSYKCFGGMPRKGQEIPDLHEISRDLAMYSNGFRTDVKP